MTLVVDGASLSVRDVVGVAREGWKVRLASSAQKKVENSRRILRSLLRSGRTIYGVNTGFGSLAFKQIPLEDAVKLQANLIRSHAAGIGKPLPEDVVRAALLLRLNTLASGFSGVRLPLLRKLVQLLNTGISPLVPESGSLGASGDLAPSAHMALVLAGEGEAYYRGQRLTGEAALKQAGLKPLKLSFKEGLALINGTQVMTSIALLLLHDSTLLLKLADVSAAMSLEALGASLEPFDERIHGVRPHPGQAACASNIRRVLEDSGLLGAGNLVQDAYSIRCVPQVHGALRDGLNYIRQVVEIELNSATDNPLVFSKDRAVLSGGNFHGQPIGLALDFAGLLLAELSVMSLARIGRLLNPFLSGLPGFLTRHAGLHSGLMITEYTAASLVAENRVLCYPAGVQGVSVSAGQEDHASLGLTAGMKAMKILANSQAVLGVECLCAAQAYEFRRGRKGKGTAQAYALIRRHVSELTADRVLYPDLERVCGLIRANEILEAVEREVGQLG